MTVCSFGHLQNYEPMKEKNNISFRDYTLADFDEVINLWKRTGMGGAERGDNNEVIMMTIKAGGNLTLMIKNNKIIGTVLKNFYIFLFTNLFVNYFKYL